ncbi:unnamed protein product, partial [Timema podura]|nr:unnamed protein product [Timema podura]
KPGNAGILSWSIVDSETLIPLPHCQTDRAVGSVRWELLINRAKNKVSSDLENRKLAHEIIALEILTLLVESPTDDSVEVAIAFLKECGMKLMEVSNKGVHAIFEMLRNILHEGQLDKRVQYMIEVIFQVRKDNFRDHEAITPDLDLVEEADQFTHLITLDEATDPDDILNVFKFDAEYEDTEAKYLALRKEILDEGSGSSGDESGSESGSDEEESG